MEAALDIRLNIPKSDFRFFKELAMRIGWKVEMQGKKCIIPEVKPYPTLDKVRAKQEKKCL